MKKLNWNSSARAALYLAACGAVVPAAANNGGYIGAESGLNYEHHQFVRPDAFPATRVDFEHGVVGGLELGYSFANGLRPEIGLDYRRNSLERLRVSPTLTSGAVVFNNVGGHEDLYSALGNLWYDIKTPSGFFHVVHPYFGAGIGWGRLSLRSPEVNGVRGRNSFDSALAWQFGAGIGIDFTRHLTLSADYRHVRTRLQTLDPGPPIDDVDTRYRADSGLISMRYRFGKNPKPAPVYEPVVLPPPPPPPVADPCADDSDNDGVSDCSDKCPATPRGFKVDESGCIIEQSVILRSVNFVFNSDQLTAPAQDSLNEVAAALVGQPALAVRIVGHTDSVGSPGYNRKLSQRRAESVRRYLITGGVSDANLQATGMGQSQPIAGNDTEEGRAQNRRVEFVVLSQPANVKVKAGESTSRSKQAAESGEPPSVKKRRK